MKRSFRLVLSLIILVNVAVASFGWWDLSHTAINKAAHVDGTSVGQLPDAWPRQGDGFKFMLITEWFCWTHQVQTTGQNWWWGGICPNEPSYPADGREPGAYMLTLLRDKMSNPDPAGMGLPEKTALSFSYHNAADSVVHFKYFTGGNPWKWVVGHRLKEEWADYMIYTLKMGGGFNDIIVTGHEDDGAPTYGGGGPNITLPVIVSGDERIIQLAQQAFIKNRLSTKAGSTDGIKYGLSGAEDIDVIYQRIEDYRADVKTANDAMHVLTYENVKSTGHLLGWDKNDCAELKAKFDEAVKAVEAVK